MLCTRVYTTSSRGSRRRYIVVIGALDVFFFFVSFLFFLFLGCRGVPVERRRRQSIKRLYLLIKTPPPGDNELWPRPGGDDLNIKRETGGIFARITKAAGRDETKKPKIIIMF